MPLIYPGPQALFQALLINSIAVGSIGNDKSDGCKQVNIIWIGSARLLAQQDVADLRNFWTGHFAVQNHIGQSAGIAVVQPVLPIHAEFYVGKQVACLLIVVLRNKGLEGARFHPFRLHVLLPHIHQRTGMNNIRVPNGFLCAVYDLEFITKVRVFLAEALCIGGNQIIDLTFLMCFMNMEVASKQ